MFQGFEGSLIYVLQEIISKIQHLNVRRLHESIFGNVSKPKKKENESIHEKKNGCIFSLTYFQPILTHKVVERNQEAEAHGGYFLPCPKYANA